MDILKLKLIEYGFALVVAPLAAIVFQALKRLYAWVDQLSEWPKRAFVTVIVMVFVAIGTLTGIDFGITPDTANLDFLNQIELGTVKTILGAVVAFLLHSVKKQFKK